MYKLGYRPQEYSKSIYFDGHERADVVASRKVFIEEVEKLRMLSREYHGDDLDQFSEVDPKVLGNARETVFVYHDESTVHAQERPTLSWLLPGVTELRSKNKGRLIHISDFILESTGRLVLSPEFIECQSSTPSVTDAAVVIHPGTKGDPWWDMSQLIDQIKTRALPIFDLLHPDKQGVFVFDCSSAHEAYGASALRVQNMSLSSGGKQGLLRDTIIPSDDSRILESLRGKPQTMVFPQDHVDPTLSGKAKGIRVVLQERGLWKHYEDEARNLGRPALLHKCADCRLSGIARDAQIRSRRIIQEAEARGYFEMEPANPSTTPQPFPRSDCCWSKILSLQSDFLHEKPLLQMVIEEAGHRCLFLPKFHCELNPIELFWSFIKTEFRTHSLSCKTFKEAQALFERVRKLCPLSTIRKYFRKIDRQHSAYKAGLSGAAAHNIVKKYRSHRQIPANAFQKV